MHKYSNKNIFKVITLTSLFAVLFACGQRGPLYLPKEQPKKEQTINKPNEPEQEQTKGS